jgi:hypothetical protein
LNRTIGRTASMTRQLAPHVLYSRLQHGHGVVISSRTSNSEHSSNPWSYLPYCHLLTTVHQLWFRRDVDEVCAVVAIVYSRFVERIGPIFTGRVRVGKKASNLYGRFYLESYDTGNSHLTLPQSWIFLTFHIFQLPIYLLSTTCYDSKLWYKAFTTWLTCGWVIIILVLTANEIGILG